MAIDLERKIYPKKKQHSRLYYGCLTLTLLIFAQLTLPAFAEADTPDQQDITETGHTDSPAAFEQDAPETGPIDKDVDNAPEPDPGPEPAQPPAEQNLPPGDPEESPAPSPSEDLTSAQVAAASDLPQSAPGNSYRAMVLPENGSAVKAGEDTELTATFTELSTDDTPLASAFLYIPNTLTIVDYSDVLVSEGWGYSWETPGEGYSDFSDILSLWATIDSAILNKDKSVSATFTVTATADQEHHFATSAWQDRATNEADEEVEPGTTVNNRSTSYSEPRINIAVTSASDLNQVRYNPHWHYLQRNDIDLSSL